MSESASQPVWKKYGSAAAAVISILVLGGVILRFTLWAPPSPGDVSRQRVVICAETGEVFRGFVIKDGSTIPFTNPKTGKATLYPSETCHWTKDGKAKLEATYVLLNENAGKPGPTTCPDCGRPVVAHNPMPPAELLAEAWQKQQSSK